MGMAWLIRLMIPYGGRGMLLGWRGIVRIVGVPTL